MQREEKWSIIIRNFNEQNSITLRIQQRFQQRLTELSHTVKSKRSFAWLTGFYLDAIRIKVNKVCILYTTGTVADTKPP